uniref:Uncharacterized protein n=1 Tax=Tanacetum cinerariifolium TaxID=118510 RepID=A0A699KCG2_TANCI|nr:hypothetical protein [Tanacetum cinerariifolium]
MTGANPSKIKWRRSIFRVIMALAEGDRSKSVSNSQHKSQILKRPNRTPRQWAKLLLKLALISNAARFEPELGFSDLTSAEIRMMFTKITRSELETTNQFLAAVSDNPLSGCFLLGILKSCDSRKELEILL